MQAVAYHDYHQHKIGEVNREKILPFEMKQRKRGKVHLNQIITKESTIALPINHTIEGMKSIT